MIYDLIPRNNVPFIHDIEVNIDNDTDILKALQAVRFFPWTMGLDYIRFKGDANELRIVSVTGAHLGTLKVCI